MHTTSKIAISLLVSLFCLMSSCTSITLPTGVNGVAIIENHGGNIFPPPPVTHDPLAGAIITLQPQGSGGSITTQISDSKGGFRIEVPFGSYLLSAQAPSGSRFLIAPERQTVIVTPQRLTQVVVTFQQLSPF